MQGDFTRDTFRPASDYYRVLLQQGRVAVDADWNEQIAILLQRMETLIVDVFGAHGGPDSHCGFAVFARESGELHLSKGRYYVDGLMCENHEIRQLRPPPHQQQPSARAYLVYLDVYEEYVSAAQDPALADPALGGLDTAGRSRIRWIPRYWRIESEPPAGKDAAREHWERHWQRALPEIERTSERGGPPRIRVAAPQGYTGAENHLYRVEIHQGGKSGPDSKVTWKWSRENGSVALGITGPGSNATQIELRTNPLTTGAFSEGDWVEIATDADVEDERDARPLYRVSAVDPTGAGLTLDRAPLKFERYEQQIVRRWDQRKDVDGNDLAAFGGCLPLIEDQALDVECGITVTFSPPEGNAPRHYRGGDYWLIPARIGTGSIEWPTHGEESAAMPPHSRHRYAPLAGLTVEGSELRTVHDFRILRGELTRDPNSSP
jgi:hypothetical protein